jgi:Ca2+-binding RTX toxin-like protein
LYSRPELWGGGALLALSASASCPPGYPTPSATSCEFSHLTSTSICTLSSAGSIWTCSLELSSSGGTPEIWVVTDYDTTGSDYEAWGSYYDGSSTQTFCCETSSAINQIVVFGSSDDDNVNLSYNNGTLYELKPVSGASSLGSYVATGDGEDTINGSGYASSTYSEYLCGQGGDDEVEGHPGDDELFGDGCPSSTFPTIPQGIYGVDPDGDDIIVGGYGIDTIYGGGGDDTISGGGGDDKIYGEDGLDHIFGNSGDDIIEGGDGVDCLKGGPDDDDIDGGDGVDTLIGGTGEDYMADSTDFNVFWGAQSTDTGNCTGLAAEVDNYTSVSGTCILSYITTAPSCP